MMARTFGIILIVLVCGWDVDAMRAHILAHSWYTLALVALFLVAHLGDYLTIGRLIYRFDPHLFERSARASAPLFLVEKEAAGRDAGEIAASSSFAEVAYATWQRLFAYEPPPSLVPPPSRARLYAFKAVEAGVECAVGGPVKMRPRYSVVAMDDVRA